MGSIDRLGRNYDEILEQWRVITKEIRAGGHPCAGYAPAGHQRPPGFDGTLIADIVLQLLSYVAQSERENIRKRQAAGIAAAKARGVLLGRPAKEMPEDFDQWYLRWRSREIIATEIEAHCDVHITTILRHAKKRGLPYTPPHQPGKCKSTDTQNTPSS